MMSWVCAGQVLSLHKMLQNSTVCTVLSTSLDAQWYQWRVVWWFLLENLHAHNVWWSLQVWFASILQTTDPWKHMYQRLLTCCEWCWRHLGRSDSPTDHTRSSCGPQHATPSAPFLPAAIAILHQHGYTVMSCRYCGRRHATPSAPFPPAAIAKPHQRGNTVMPFCSSCHTTSAWQKNQSQACILHLSSILFCMLWLHLCDQYIAYSNDSSVKKLTICLSSSWWDTVIMILCIMVYSHLCWIWWQQDTLCWFSIGQAHCAGNVCANVSMRCTLKQYMPRLDLTYTPMYLSPSAGDAINSLNSKSAHVMCCCAIVKKDNKWPYQ